VSSTYSPVSAAQPCRPAPAPQDELRAPLRLGSPLTPRAVPQGSGRCSTARLRPVAAERGELRWHSEAGRIQPGAVHQGVAASRRGESRHRTVTRCPAPQSQGTAAPCTSGTAPPGLAQCGEQRPTSLGSYVPLGFYHPLQQLTTTETPPAPPPSTRAPLTAMPRAAPAPAPAAFLACSATLESLNQRLQTASGN